jgi:hypothetical protein
MHRKQRLLCPQHLTTYSRHSLVLLAEHSPDASSEMVPEQRHQPEGWNMLGGQPPPQLGETL